MKARDKKATGPGPAPLDPATAEAETYLADASGPPLDKSAPMASRFARQAAQTWLVEHGLASPWPRLRDPATSSVVETTAIGTPTAAAVAAERARNRPRPRLVSVAIDEIEAEEVSWLWPGRIPLGRVSVVMGRQGKGKSTLVSWLAATVSTGAKWPDSFEDNSPGGVLILSAEESAAQDLRPRLDAFGFAPGRIRIVKGVTTGDEDRTRGFNLAADVEALRDEIERRGDVRLVIVDPLGSYIRGISGYNEAEVREYLQPLFDLAEEAEVAVVLVAHPNKDAEKEILDRVSGSGAFTQMARMSWYFSDDPRDPSRRLLSLMKGNLAGAVRTAIAVSYQARNRRLFWHGEPVELDAQAVDNLLQRAAREAKLNARPGPDPVAAAAAQDFILSYLDKGPAMQSVVQDQALNVGVKESSFRKGLKRLIADDGRVKRERRGEDSRWWLFLATAAPPAGPEGDSKGGESDGSHGAFPIDDPPPSP